MSILVQNVSMQQLKHEFESFLKRFYRKLLVLQPQIYIVSNITKDAVHLQITWKSIYLQTGTSLIMHPPLINQTI